MTFSHIVTRKMSFVGKSASCDAYVPYLCRKFTNKQHIFNLRI